MSAVSAGLRVQLQPVDVPPPVDLQATVARGLVGAVGVGRAGHQGSPCPGEDSGCARQSRDARRPLIGPSVASRRLTTCLCNTGRRRVPGSRRAQHREGDEGNQLQTSAQDASLWDGSADIRGFYLVKILLELKCSEISALE